MAQVFLSYSREDEAAAKQLADALEASGLRVWWDRTIPPGKTFDQVIEEALDNSSWALVLWSATSIESNWVKAEAEEALRRGTLVPVLIEDVRPPMAFRRIEAAELQSWDGDTANPEFANLLKALGSDAPPPPKVFKRQAKVEPAAEPSTPTQAGPAARPGMATATKIALGVAGAIGLVLATVAVTNMGNGGAGEPARERVEQPPNEAMAPEELRQPAPSQGAPAKQAPSTAVREEPQPAPQQQVQARPIAPQRPASGSITLRYSGDAYDCSLNIQITVAGQTIVPQTNVVAMSDIPLGPTDYSVNGVISCPTVGACNAAGSGQINVVNGGLYDLIWQNTTYAHCSVTFVQSG